MQVASYRNSRGDVKYSPGNTVSDTVIAAHSARRVLDLWGGGLVSMKLIQYCVSCAQRIVKLNLENRCLAGHRVIGGAELLGKANMDKDETKPEASINQGCKHAAPRC